jgi:hypothetical protein
MCHRGGEMATVRMCPGRQLQWDWINDARQMSVSVNAIRSRYCVEEGDGRLMSITFDPVVYRLPHQDGPKPRSSAR